MPDDLIASMRKAASQVFDARHPADWCTGKVISLEPFQVQIEQKLPVGKKFLTVRQGVSAASFKVGDVLLLLQKQGGQNYLILDKKGAL